MAFTSTRRTFEPETLRRPLQPLNLDVTPDHDGAVTDYFGFYGLDLPVAHHFGTYRSGITDVAAHVFVPDQPRGSVYLAHGYYDHAGILRNVIRLCVEERFAVAALDLPGHGLSSGERASIDEFGQYSDALCGLVALCRSHLPEPCLLARCQDQRP